MSIASSNHEESEVELQLKGALAIFGPVFFAAIICYQYVALPEMLRHEPSAPHWIAMVIAAFEGFAASICVGGSILVLTWLFKPRALEN